MNGNGRLPMSGSNADMIVSYIIRAAIVVVQGVLVLLLWAVFRLGVEIRDDTRDLKRDWPALQKSVSDVQVDIAALKKQGETFATKTQLEAAEMRVKNEFTRQLEEQVKNNKTQAKEKMNYAR